MCMWAILLVCYMEYHNYSWKYWWKLNLAQNHYCNNIGEPKFGGLVEDHYTIIHVYASKLVWQLLRWTTKPPNLIPRQNFPAAQHQYVPSFLSLSSQSHDETTMMV